MKFKQPLVLATLCLLMCIPGQWAHAAGKSAETQPPEVAAAAAVGGEQRALDGTRDKRLGTRVFDTGDSSIVPDTPNQGWWSAGNDNYPLNANYVVGGRCGSGEFRNFFTFDLRSLSQRVVSASLRINTKDLVGDAYETLRLFDVSTDPQTLNSRQGQNAAIFADLGTGKMYGTYTLSTEQDDVVVDLHLNRNAIRALNRARGNYFSIGGRLISIESRSPGVNQEQYMFSNSSREQTVALVTNIRKD